MTKDEQRIFIKNNLSKLSNKESLDELIYKNVLSLDINVNNILIYNSIKSEVSTKKIINYFIDKANVYMPVVIGNKMGFVKIDKNTKYKKGAFNIEEPIGDIEYDVLFDLCITPLLGYDKNLNRLGKGKGYYDRFFLNQKKCIKMALAYSCQELENIIVDSFDIKMDMIINEYGVIK